MSFASRLDKFVGGKGFKILSFLLFGIVIPLFFGAVSIIKNDGRNVLQTWIFYFLCFGILGFIILNIRWKKATERKTYNLPRNSHILVMVIWFIQSFCLSFWFYLLFSNYFTFFLFIEVIIIVDFIQLTKCKLRNKIYLYFFGYPTSILISFCFLSLMSFGPLLFFQNEYLNLIIFSILLSISIVSLPITLLSKSSKNYDQIFISMKKPMKQISSVQRFPTENKTSQRCLRIIQITDPHIGTIMSVNRLKYICEQTVALNPDVIALTGDFFTVLAYAGGYGVPKNSFSLKEGLAPLKPYADRCVACLGVNFLFFSWFPTN